MDTYEKKYKEALELARVAAFNGHQSLMEGIFPELAESEDEKVRKRIIALVNAHGQGMYKDDMLAWLEKQGEQKPQGKSALEAINEEKADNANKVEPRQEEFTEFERAVKQVMKEAIECGDTHNLKADAEMLLSLVHNSAWSEKDEKEYKYVLKFVDNILNNCGNKKDYEHCKRCYDWLKSLKQKIGGNL